MNFQWSKLDGSFILTMPGFSGEPPGITNEFPPVQHDCDYFLVYLSNDVLDHIVSETNIYHDKCTESHDVPLDLIRRNGQT